MGADARISRGQDAAGQGDVVAFPGGRARGQGVAGAEAGHRPPMARLQGRLEAVLASHYAPGSIEREPALIALAEVAGRLIASHPDWLMRRMMVWAFKRWTWKFVRGRA